MKTIYLVSCVNEKESEAKVAKELYKSDWFKKARAFAERNADQWFILSAKYGAISPDQVIDTYNETLNEKRWIHRRLWSCKVTRQLEALGLDFENTEDTRIVFLAGDFYREELEEDFRECGFLVEVPMRGLFIGEQKSWLLNNEYLERAEEARVAQIEAETKVAESLSELSVGATAFVKINNRLTEVVIAYHVEESNEAGFEFEGEKFRARVSSFRVKNTFERSEDKNFMLNEFSSKQFTLSGKTLVAEISELSSGNRRQVFGQVYQDSCDEGLRVVSAKTGASVDFYVYKTDNGSEGEIAGWRLRPTRESIKRVPTCERVEVLVIND